MQGFLNSMSRHPGRAIIAVMAINILLSLGGIAAIAVAVRYALTGHIG